MQKKIQVSMSKITLDTTKLESIEREIKKKFVTRVGILGEKAAGRQNTVAKVSKSGKHLGNKPGAAPSDMSNADIGILQEKGSKSDRIPRRSFIEMPLQLKLPGIIEKLGQAVLNGLTNDNIKLAYKKLGILGENIVQGAFATTGYGKWAKNAPRTIAQKKSSQPLIDTAQLRKSITSTVVTKAT